MGKKSGGDEAKRARRDEQQRQARIREGTSRVNGIFGKNFSPDFFANRRGAFLNWATPQLDQQYGDAQKELTFSLDRSGLLDSTVRGDKVSQLQRLYDTQKQGIADKAVAEETGARNAVEDARGNLISTLNATGDAEGAASSALNRASALTQPAAYSPLSQMFGDFTAGLGAYYAQQKSQQLQQLATGGGGAQLYSPGSGSVKVT